MALNNNSNLNQKLIKCRSLQSLHCSKKMVGSPGGNNTRPKLETIKPKQFRRSKQYTQIQHKEEEYCDDYQGSNKAITRIKSVDQLTQIRQTATFENIVGLYKKENDNLKQQNKYLIKQIRKKQKNEQVLNNYIQQLRREIKGLQNQIHMSPVSSYPKSTRSPTPRPPKISMESRVQNPLLSTKTSVQSKGLIYIEGDTWNTVQQIEDLNGRFNILMDQCSKQTCPKTRNLLRGKLAETADRMKLFKKQIYHLQ